ncbi:hypothetical protein PanWU01x14_143010 [Parasponia andersonii]|uniref:Uncharacterized protein n=1 Tax=Parasponia andersonii TaxID=3476 RepID=A0A2P5CLG0_PARAD|nr:hypothetical protein PanWU01x14_143010 [Parasponia andersonii]
MTEHLDRFITALLLSAYGFNDYRSKSSLNSDLDDSLEIDDHGKRLDAVSQGTSDGVAGHELDFHGGVSDVRVIFHGASSPLVIDDQTLNLVLGQNPNRSIHGFIGNIRDDFHSATPPLVNDNQTLNLELGQDPNRSIHGVVDDIRIDFYGAPPPLVNDNQTLNLGLGVNSRLPSVSSGAHGLVDLGAHGLVLGAARDGSQSAHGLVLGVASVSHFNVDSHGAVVKDSHVSFKVINSSPLASDQGLSFMAFKNKGVNLDSSKKVVNIAGGFKKVQDFINKVQDFGAPSFAQVVNSTATRDKVPLIPDP